MATVTVDFGFEVGFQWQRRQWILVSRLSFSGNSDSRFWFRRWVSVATVTVDFGFGIGFRWQRWVYVWVSTATVGLALGFNGAGGGFVVGLMDFAVGLDLGFEGGGLRRWGLGLQRVSA